MHDLTQFTEFYEQLDQTLLHKLTDIYSDDVVFIDPVTQHSGLEAIHGYFERLLQNTKDCRFEIQKARVDGATGYISWRMTFCHPRLNRGGPINVEGFSLTIFRDGKICEQRDYYDMGAMIYEHIPVLGGVVSHLRRRMAA